MRKGPKGDFLLRVARCSPASSRRNRNPSPILSFQRLRPERPHDETGGLGPSRHPNLSRVFAVTSVATTNWYSPATLRVLAPLEPLTARLHNPALGVREVTPRLLVRLAISPLVRRPFWSGLGPAADPVRSPRPAPTPSPADSPAAATPTATRRPGLGAQARVLGRVGLASLRHGRRRRRQPRRWVVRRHARVRISAATRRGAAGRSRWCGSTPALQPPRCSAASRCCGSRAASPRTSPSRSRRRAP